jgi:hypothetical protein
MFARFRMPADTVPSEVNVNLSQVLHFVPEGDGSTLTFVNGTTVTLPNVSNQTLRGAIKRASARTKEDEPNPPAS